MAEDEALYLDTEWGSGEVAVWVGDTQTIYVDPEDGSIETEGNNHVPWRSGMVSVRVTTDSEVFLDLSPEEAREWAAHLCAAAERAAAVVPTVEYVS